MSVNVTRMKRGMKRTHAFGLDDAVDECTGEARQELLRDGVALRLAVVFAVFLVRLGCLLTPSEASPTTEREREIDAPRRRRRRR